MSLRYSFIALCIILASTSLAQRPNRDYAAAGDSISLQQLRSKGVVLLKSDNYGLELSSGMTVALLNAGIPVYVDPVRVLNAGEVVITGGEREQEFIPQRTNDMGFETPDAAYGLLIEVADRLPSYWRIKHQMRVYLIDRSTGSVHRFVTADGVRDDDDATEVLAALLSISESAFD